MITSREFSIAHTVTTSLSYVVDIQNFDRFNVNVQTKGAAAGVIHVQLDVSTDPTSGSTPSNWIAINTAAYPYPSTVATATISPMGSASHFENTYKWLKITLTTCATAAIGQVVAKLTGQTSIRSSNGPGYTGANF